MVLIAFRELYSTNMKLEDNYTYISTSLNSIWYVALDFETKGVNISIILLTESIHQFQNRSSEFWFIKFAVSFNLVKERTLLHKSERVQIKSIYSEKVTQFREISTVDLTITTQDKSTVEISQKFVAFLEYMNFKNPNDEGMFLK